MVQFLVKSKAQAGLISTAASTLADMLWAQDMYEEAEEALVQSCQVSYILAHMHATFGSECLTLLLQLTAGS